MVRCINLDAGEPPASDGTNLDLADARGPAQTSKQRRILASKKKWPSETGPPRPPTRGCTPDTGSAAKQGWSRPPRALVRTVSAHQSPPSRPPEVTIEYLKELRGLILDAHLRMLGTGTGRATNSAHRGVPQDRSHPPQPISTRSMGRVGSNDWKAEWD